MPMSPPTHGEYTFMNSFTTILLILSLCLGMLGCSKQNTPSTGSSDGQASNNAQASAPSSNWTYETVPGNSFNPPVLTASTISTNVQSVNSDGSKHDIKLVLSNSTKDAADVRAAAEARVKAKGADVILARLEERVAGFDKAVDAYNQCLKSNNVCNLPHPNGMSVDQFNNQQGIDMDAQDAAHARLNATLAAVNKDGMVEILYPAGAVSCPGDCPMQIQVRVDNGSVQTLDAYLPGDSAPGALFIKNSIDFILQIEKANHVAFNIPMGGKYQEVDFDVSGLDTDKLVIK